MNKTCSTESASAKAQALLQAGCTFCEFGTQRRRSFYTQDLVVGILKQEADRSPGQGVFVGTSNVRIVVERSFTVTYKLIFNPQRVTLQRNTAFIQWLLSRSKFFVCWMIWYTYGHGSEWFMGVSIM